ncbi:serine hydrolase domain-containing protein [Frondihabitans australicus]|uniref:CubicO group peptidase (Beta-lactamase class C family) n=1 Tax=Frondihabitans australicus TaxID=386892 RepID=A0A495IDK3_9MICO|nr:serine hydrolase [Frondihabitans australicus]RKR74062.1 CubicO group peptidase (beta-lactamase class C family) [Frondihabitans australicus]
MTTALPRSTPSAENIDPKGITALVDALESTEGVEPHSLMILRHGRVVAETWWAPYEPERPHLLYSVSKSFTAVAASFAIAEGMMSLDDTILSHFPELDDEITDPRSRSIRVRDVLAMSSGHDDETFARAQVIDPLDIVRGFLLIPPDHEPGSWFAYNQPCTYSVGAIIQKHSGGSLVDYLRPRLFDPLGIGHAGWQQDASGRQLAFTGLHATTGALARLGQLYLQNGQWEGRQLLSPEWVADATTSHIDTSRWDNPDWRLGYGYFFWLSEHGYRADGAYGQFSLVIPELDLVVAITEQTTDTQAVLSAVWEHLVPAIDRATEGDVEAQEQALAARLTTSALAPVAGRGGVIAPGSYAAARGNDHPSLDLVEVEVDGDGELAVTLREAEQTLRLPVGRGRWVVTDAFAASGAVEGDVLHVDVIFLETPHRLHLALVPSSQTFTARWATPPLEPSSLAELRSPA